MDIADAEPAEQQHIMNSGEDSAATQFQSESPHPDSSAEIGAPNFDFDDNCKETESVFDQKISKTVATPAIVKLKRTRLDFKTQSPSDQLVSPCTRRLEHSRNAADLSHQVLRARQQLLGYHSNGRRILPENPIQINLDLNACEEEMDNCNEPIKKEGILEKTVGSDEMPSSMGD